MNLDNSRTLILDAGHGEYVPGAGVCIIDVYCALDLCDQPADDKAAAELASHLPAEAADLDVYDPTWCRVIAVIGTPAELEAGFYNLLGQVSVPPSGDDDTFDYWPSGARLLLQMAADLDRGRGEHWARALQAIVDVLVHKGDLADELRDKVPALELAS